MSSHLFPVPENVIADFIVSHLTSSCCCVFPHTHTILISHNRFPVALKLMSFTIRYRNSDNVVMLRKCYTCFSCLFTFSFFFCLFTSSVRVSTLFVHRLLFTAGVSCFSLIVLSRCIYTYLKLLHNGITLQMKGTDR